MCVSSCLVTANEAKKLSSNVKRRAAHGSNESMRIKAGILESNQRLCTLRRSVRLSLHMRPTVLAKI